MNTQVIPTSHVKDIADNLLTVFLDASDSNIHIFREYQRMTMQRLLVLQAVVVAYDFELYGYLMTMYSRVEDFVPGTFSVMHEAS